MELLEGLNAAQREAVLSTEGFVRVIAGAGSGKTRALTRRFAYLVTELGILPGNLLCVTFTNKAANEMRQRIHNLTGDEDTGYINTFHGFCVSILQEDSHAVGYPKSFLVLDNSDIDAMLQIIYEERGLTLRDMTFSHARDMIEMLKLKERPAYYEDMLTLPLDTLKEKYWQAESAKDIIFYGYLYQEKKCFALDYNDLIVFSLHIFRTHEDIRLKWQKRLEYIMIDEFQDIDPPQYALMQVLCEYHKNLFIVGDPDQTIYTWRGADVRYLLDFDKVYPTTKTIMMMENYRSTPEILAACNSLISKNANRIKKRPSAHAAGRRAGSVPPRGQQRTGSPLDRRADQNAPRGRDTLPRYGDFVPCTLYHARRGGNSAEGKNSVHDLQRRAVLRPRGDQGRAELSAHDRLPGRSVVPAHCERAEAQPRRTPHGVFEGLRCAERLFAL